MKRRDLRIVWSANSIHSNSGYAVFSQMLLSRMVEDGWPVAHIGWWGIEGVKLDVDLGQFNPRFKGLTLPIYPRMNEPFGGDALVEHSKDFKADVVFAMQDLWTINPQYLQQLPRFVPYFPVDKDPLPLNIAQLLPYCYRLISFSQFGHDILKKSGWASNLILEGTDTELFKPQDKAQARAQIGIDPNAFVFGMFAANKENPPRKGWQEALEAFAMFYKKHPEALLYCKIQQRAPTGFPIESYARYLDISHRVVFASPYDSVFKGGPLVISQDMNAIDVHLHPSQTEGFGLTPIEAQSCGTPTIVADNTSQPELVIDGLTGWVAKCMKPRYTADDSFVHPADPQSVYECMEKAYKALKKNPKKVAKDSRDYVLGKYNIDTIYKEKWVPFLERIQSEILRGLSPNVTY